MPTPTIDPDALDVILRSAVGAAFGEFRPLDDPGMTPAARLARLDQLDATLVTARALAADARARVIADLVDSTSSRQAAALLGVSVATVAKAVARARRDTATDRSRVTSDS